MNFLAEGKLDATFGGTPKIKLTVAQKLTKKTCVTINER